MRTSLLLIGFCLILPFRAASETFYIRADGLGDYPTIQDAITASADGDSIILLAGVYTGDGNRDISYQGKAIFVGTISGHPETCVIDCQGSPEEPHRAFVFHREPEGTA